MSDRPLEPLEQWQLPPATEPPTDFIDAVRRFYPEATGGYLAMLLWQRGIRDIETLPGFLDANRYQPASPFEFGTEMEQAMSRLQQARETGEKVTIWGDFDADGITATAVLWEGLGQFFHRGDRLNYYIPNRFSESHGLNPNGIEKLAAGGTNLIVTCDTGSTNLSEIAAAKQLGIDTIVTDHHTLSETRSDAVAIINPRYFETTHPLYHLSGVAVAYKLVEALYQTLPDVPGEPLENLLDLVAIGLISDLVQLSGDCRYLAQKGIKRLEQQLQNPTRPGIAKLLKLCKRTGDRPTDISFGLGPRINAVSRIHGDASFCVELLTSQDEKRCQELAEETELANSRRQALQRDVTELVKRKLETLDLSTNSVIILSDPQWQLGVLGLVAGQIAREYGRPVILFNTVETEADDRIPMARGSARSTNNIDLYKLVKEQSHLLHRFGGHPFAAGLSLPVSNLPLFAEAVDRALHQKLADSGQSLGTTIQADLTVTVAELNKGLFRELKGLEPCGMGNTVPLLLVRDCWFENVWHKSIYDARGNKLKYIRTTFDLWDNSTQFGFPGIWWGHYKDEVPTGRCDAIVELDYNSYKKEYEVRLISVRSRQNDPLSVAEVAKIKLLDWRETDDRPQFAEQNIPVLAECPASWDDLQKWLRSALKQHADSSDITELALSYSPPQSLSPETVWQQFVGMAKYLSRTEETVSRHRLCQRLNISDRTLQQGLNALKTVGFEVAETDSQLYLRYCAPPGDLDGRERAIANFFAAVREEEFRRQYFARVPLSTLGSLINS